jgi:ribulose 1,5-bisphosphate synthetase/thiazole synthase
MPPASGTASVTAIPYRRLKTIGWRKGSPVTARADVVVVGGGHNGLVAAAYLARSGLKVVVCERREVTGGAAVSTRSGPTTR